MALLQSVRIFSPADRADRLAAILRRMTKEQLESIRISWEQILARQAEQAKLTARLKRFSSDTEWQDCLNRFGCPDARWQWSIIADPTTLGISRESFCIESDGKVQCAMLVSLTERCRLATQASQHLVYIDYLAVAPWNRPRIATPIQLSGLGTIMLGIAVSLSKDEGWNGRVGLHSLPQSEGFYVRHGMTNLGQDAAKEDLTYFEYTEDSAEQFLPAKESK